MKKIIALIIALLLLTLSITALADPASEYLKGSDTTDTSESSDTGASDTAAESFDGGDIVNGDFSSDTEGWAFYSYENVISASSVSTMELTEYEKGFCMHVSSSSPDDARARQQVSVYPECYYSISAYVKTENVSGGNGANIAIDEVPDAHSDPIFGTTDWQLVSFNVCTGRNMTVMTVDLRIGGYGAEAEGDVWFDFVKVEFMTEAPAEYIPLEQEAESEVINADDDKSGSFTLLTVALIVLIAVLVVGTVVYVFIYNAKNTKPATEKTATAHNQVITSKVGKERRLLLTPTDTKLYFKKIDWIFLIVLITVYGVVALTNLGTTQAPVTEWVAKAGDEPAVITFNDGDKQISDICVFGSILGEYSENGTVTIYNADGKELTQYTELYGDMFRWHKISVSAITSGLTVKPTGITVVFREIAVLDENGNYIPCTVNESAAALCDEPDMVPAEMSSMNGMYFDELYHGRTAYEHLNNLKSYENSHPPLGKILISIGIAIFGMNAFGWRVVGAVFGIAMLPVFYLICKRIFKDRSFYAMCATTLFAFDFMHFVQTRIATIDVYGVFFILLMFYFMYWYFSMSFYRDGLVKTFIPLGLCGISFGLGAASKWIGFYAGAGLALLLFISFIRRIYEWNKYKNSANEEYARAVKDCWGNIILTSLFCVGFFIIIPVIIYALSYLGYPDVKFAFTDTLRNGGNIISATGAYLDKVWGYQEFMYNYHSGLTSTHTYQSTWIQWILDLRPIWYAINYFPNNHVSTISSFGNPIVWWLSFAGTVGMIVQIIRKKIQLDTTVIVILVGIACNLLPWVVFVKRCVFIYHYFATVPFIILAAMYCIKSLEDEFAWFAYFKWAWTGIALALFGLFYPILTAVKIPESYALSLEWFKSWWFVRNADAPTNAGVVNGIICIVVMIAIFVVAGLLYRSYLKQHPSSKSKKNTTIEI